MKYQYTARTKEGELQVGSVEAPDKDAAINILTSHELFVLSIEGEEEKSWLEQIGQIFKRVKTSDIMFFTRQFSTLLESKVSIGDSLRGLYKQTKNPVLKEIIFEVSADIDAGLSLSQALERQKQYFSDFYVNMIKSAEITGRLEESMIFLADYLEKEGMWKSKIRNAMTYPIFVIVLFLAVGVILMTVVFPKLIPIFTESGVELPVYTKIIFGIGTFLANWWWFVIIVTIGLIIFLINYFKTAEGQAVASELFMRTPILGNLFRRIYVARFSESLGVLLKGGIPLAQAIEITSQNIGNVVYRDALGMAAERVRAGESFSAILSQSEYYFPALVGQMVAIGESTGRLDEILGRIAVFYTREVDNVLNNLVELIQPMLMVVIGIFVGLLFAAVLVPIYNLAQGFKKI
ncbi:type II secretion system F family protein [Candidatus Wolfebacteria bacterium]|nr:type II secretion system F family protein [Candidatus Wolfebacteria bacterium]